MFEPGSEKSILGTKYKGLLRPDSKEKCPKDLWKRKEF